MTSPASGADSGDYAPIPRSALGPALNDQGYYVGRVERNLYWVTDGVYQSAFMTTRDGVVVFDAPPTIGDNLRRAVDEIAAANGVTNRVTHFVYSHHHADHGGAAALFGGDVTRIGHQETRRLLLRDNDPARPVPEITFADRYTLEVGGERVDLAWHGPNHSPDNIYMHFPGHDTLMFIDVVNAGWVLIYNLNLSEDVIGYMGASAAVTSINGIVHLQGGIKTSGTNPVPFTLPAGDRPAAEVYVPVDLCNGDNGRLDITHTGVVTVETEGGTNWGNAQCLTSLDGVSFAASANSFTPLTLQNGWVNYGFGTASPAAREISGIVHLEGAIKTSGTNQVAFTLPAGDRPALRIFVPVDLCGATNGDLFIQADGSVTVEAQGGNWSNAQCFTSLDGVSFAPSANSFTPVTLENGWTSTGLASAPPAVRVISGIVHLEGDMYTNGINPVPFTLPAGDRPAHNVAVKVALCGEDSGVLIIGPGGEATVQAEGGNWANAQCQTSLDGVWFAR